MRARGRAGVAISIAIAVALGSACDNSALPEGERLPEKPVEILVDDLGIAHVYAQSDRDAMWGAGYRMASDRLYQMEMLRRFAQGRLSEVLGEEGFERDRLARAFDLRRWGKEDMAATREADPERVELVHAWVKGINARVKEIRGGAAPRPFGYRPTEKDFLPEEWAEEDPYVVLKGAGLALDKTIEFEIALTLLERIYPDAMGSVDVLKPAERVFSIPDEDRPKELGPVAAAETVRAAPSRRASREDARAAFDALSRMLDAFPRASGSNNWAVDGTLTATGKPMVAGDPHLAFDFFGAPYPLHINSRAAGGTFDVAGFAYPGTPGIALGHNDKVVWAATSAFGDVTDVWEVKKVGEGDRIAIAGKEAPLSLRTEKIVVRAPGAPAGEGRTEEIEYADAPGYGVVLPDGLVPIPVGGPFLVNWTGFKGRPLRWFMELNRVQSIDEFERAVDRMKEMNYNFVAADASGIAYRVGVDVPVRAPITPSRRPWTVIPGGDAESFWSGAMLAPERHPHGRAGARHLIATANNDPFGITAGDVASAPFYYGAFFDPGFRAARITSELTRLAARGNLTVDDMKTLQLDTKSTMAGELATALAAAHARIATDPALAEVKGDPALDALVKLLTVDWDREMKRDSRGALAFQALLHHVMSEVLKDDIPLGYDFALKLQTVFIAKVALSLVLGKYPKGDAIVQGGRDLVLLRAAKKTAAFLVAKFGAVDAAPYSARKVTNFDHALGFGVLLSSTPTDGGEDTINVSQNISFDFDPGDAPWVSSYVSVERTVATIGPDGVPEAHVTFPFAAAADPGSAEQRAANGDYVDGRHKVLPFRRADVEARTVQRETLRP